LVTFFGAALGLIASNFFEGFFVFLGAFFATDLFGAFFLGFFAGILPRFFAAFFADSAREEARAFFAFCFLRFFVLGLATTNSFMA